MGVAVAATWTGASGTASCDWISAGCSTGVCVGVDRASGVTSGAEVCRCCAHPVANRSTAASTPDSTLTVKTLDTFTTLTIQNLRSAGIIPFTIYDWRLTSRSRCGDADWIRRWNSAIRVNDALERGVYAASMHSLNGALKFTRCATSERTVKRRKEPV